MSIKLKIESFDHEGKGIARDNKKIVFVPNTIPGEVVEANVTKEKKNYLEGKVVSFIQKSSRRINSLCPYYDKCGGCAYLHVDIEEEEKIKTENVINILKKYANLDIKPKFICSNKEYNYRNKIELKINNNEWGYYNSSSHDFILVDKCLIAKDSINKIIANKEYFNIKDGSITIRSNYNDELIIKIETDKEYFIDVNKLVVNSKIVGIIVNNKIIYGEDNYIERVGNYLFKVNINSFFQINLDVLEKIFDILKLGNYQTVVDLYCGVGTLGIPCRKEKLYGLEITPEAIKDAITNSKINKQDNLYLLGDSSKIREINDKIDTIIIDPPRNGLNKDTLKNILNINSNNIIYMSCNPLTLARDLNILKDTYNINDFYILNMFPRTKHVECICILKCR